MSRRIIFFVTVLIVVILDEKKKRYRNVGCFIKTFYRIRTSKQTNKAWLESRHPLLVISFLEREPLAIELYICVYT